MSNKKFNLWDDLLLPTVAASFVVFTLLGGMMSFYLSGHVNNLIKKVNGEDGKLKTYHLDVKNEELEERIERIERALGRGDDDDYGMMTWYGEGEKFDKLEGLYDYLGIKWGEEWTKN